MEAWDEYISMIARVLSSMVKIYVICLVTIPSYSLDSTTHLSITHANLHYIEFFLMMFIPLSDCGFPINSNLET